MKRILFLVCLVVAFSGCRISTPKDEAICIDLVKKVVPNPEGLIINRVERTDGKASLEDLRTLYSKRFSGNIPSGTQGLLDLYEKENISVSETFVSLDVTYDGRMGKMRENILCRYLNYDEKKELISFTFQNKDIEQHKFIDLFLSRKKPSDLDSSYRVR
jgi:hypothetical protein